MIYITGDTHGTIDIRKLLDNQITEKMTKDDYVIICGDFGLVWNHKKETRQEKKWLDWLNGRPWTTLFCDGNHECFPRLNALPVLSWHGGHVHQVRPKILHLMRGEIFEINGESFFVMGGASSHDRGPFKGDTHAVINRSWWPDELPSDEELVKGKANLASHGNKVDYIITHCLPSPFQEYLKHGAYPNDRLTDYFAELTKIVKFRHWYSGHYHCNIDVTPRVTVVFSRIMNLGTNIKNSETVVGFPKYRKNDTVFFMQGEETIFGTIKEVMPWGTLVNHQEPFYDIIPLEQTKKITVRETEILEKSMIYTGDPIEAEEAERLGEEE